MIESLLDPNIPMDTYDNYLGAVLKNNQWRFFYSSRLNWAIDMRGFHLQNIPDNRKQHLYYPRDKFEDFLGTLDVEFTAQHIHARVGKLPLQVLIDFDNSRIVEGTYMDEGFNLCQAPNL
jgi:hypothetical protein